MKKMTFNIGSLLLIIGFSLISTNVFSQGVKLTRQEQKEAKKAEKYANFQALDTLLQRKSFVLEANYLENQYGERVIVPSLLNFIRVDSTKAVLQTGSNYYFGSNGVGGVTAEGLISQYSVDKNLKNLSYNVSFTVMSNIGIYDVFMTVNSNNYARATISGIGPGTLTYTGEIQAPYNSGVFKGQNTI